MAQLVKNPPAMWETWVQPLGWEDPLEKGVATHSSILENSMDKGAWEATDHGVAKSQTRLSDFHFTNCRPEKAGDSPRSQRKVVAGE